MFSRPCWVRRSGQNYRELCPTYALWLEEALAQERAAREDAMGQMEAALRQMETERQAKEAERQAKEAALAEVARLQALLRSAQPPGDA